MPSYAFAAGTAAPSSGSGITNKISDLLGKVLGPDLAATLKKNPFILYTGILFLLVVLYMAFKGGSGRGRKSGFLEGKKSRRRRRKKALIDI